MLAAEQIEGAAQVQVGGIAGGVAGVLLCVDLGRAIGLRFVELDRAEFGVVAVDLVIQLQLGDPAIPQVVFEHGKSGAGVLLPAAPGRAVVVGARHAVVPASGVDQRKGAGPAGALGDVVLVVAAHGQQGVGGQVEFEDAVVGRGLARIVVEERLLVLVGRHCAAANIAGFGQRPADVQFAAVVVPGAHAQGGVALELGGGLLAHQVDGGAQGAGAGQQAGGTLEHFHPVVDGHVAEGVASRIGDVAHGGGNAVVLEVVDRETAGVVVGAVGVVGRDGDARGVAHHVVDVVEAEIFHVLPGDHGDRLRCLPRGQHHASRRGDGAWGVGAAAFGDGAQLVADDLGGLQLHGLAALGQARQQHRVGAVAFKTQAGACQQLAQCLFRAHAPADPRRLDPLGQCRGVGDLQTALGTQLVQGIGQGLAGDGKTVGGGCLVAGSGGGLDRHHGVAGQADGQREDAAGRGECWKVHGSPVRNRNDLHKQTP